MCECCCRKGGKHKYGCPQTHPDKKAAIAFYEIGRKAGRGGAPKNPFWIKNPIYRLGYSNGFNALCDALNL